MSAGMLIGRQSSERQSMSRAWSRSPSAEASWSMTPQRVPTKSFSAAWARRARRVGSTLSPANAANAVATATSTDAEDDRPEPCGMVPATTRSAPVNSNPSACIVTSTPRT